MLVLNQKTLWRIGLLAAAVIAGSGLFAGEGLLGNGDFEFGEGRPEGWALNRVPGEWRQGGLDGGRCVSVTGDGVSNNYWSTPDRVQFEPGRAYEVSCWLRTEPATGAGAMITGPSFANCDFRASGEWTRHRYVLRTPDEPRDSVVRFGQWHFNGTVLYDRVAIRPVQPVNLSFGQIKLGYGESIENGAYRFSSGMGGYNANFSRVLHRLKANFNSTRWVFSPGDEVVYRHLIPGVRHVSGTVKVNVGWHAAGSCIVEAGGDGKAWTELGRLDGVGEEVFDLPGEMLPCAGLFVRLRSPLQGRKTDSEAGRFQVHGYSVRTKLDRDPGAMRGDTAFLVVTETDERLGVDVRSLGPLLPGKDNAAHVTLQSHFQRKKTLSVQMNLRHEGAPAGSVKREMALLPGVAQEMRIPCPAERVGEWSAEIRAVAENECLFAGEFAFTVPELYRSDFGYPLQSDETCGLWWCEGTYKVNRDRPEPGGEVSPVRIEAARGEYEPVQIVLRPTRKLTLRKPSVSGFSGPGNALISGDNVDVLRVEYVNVTEPTDLQGCCGWWPDPLPPVDDQISLPANSNQPLWLRVFVPRNAPPGEYTGILRLHAEDWSAAVPLELRVFDFKIPDKHSILATMGFSATRLKRYHHLQTEEQLRTVFNLYLESFRAHRIDPYQPFALGPIKTKIDVDSEKVTVDFTDFDREMGVYLDGLGLQSFRLPIRYMPRRDAPPAAGPLKMGTAQYDRIVGGYLRELQEHMREKGWLDEAYAYWVDEPAPEHYENVRYGMRLLDEYAPDIRRMLTEQPEPELEGFVDVWCPVLHRYDEESCRARQAAGEQIWWYVCCGPKAPWAGLFIDHNAIDLRIWQWMSHKYDVSGALIWATNYWFSRTRVRETGIYQNPWEDPMSYRATGGGCWGNGDGRFLYPPDADPNTEHEPIICGPVESIRWEMLREGLEDYEYFALLERLLADEPESDAAKLLEIPENILVDPRTFNRDPRPLLDHRRALAEAIERINRTHQDP